MTSFRAGISQSSKICKSCSQPLFEPRWMTACAEKLTNSRPESPAAAKPRTMPSLARYSSSSLQPRAAAAANKAAGRCKFVGPRISPSDRKSTRLYSSHVSISYAVFCLKKKREVCEALEQLDGRWRGGTQTREEGAQ